MRRGQWGLREQTEIVDNVDKSVQNSIFPKKWKKRVCKTYPQNWGQNVDNVDNKKVEHIFCATCLVYHKVGGMAEEKTFYRRSLCSCMEGLILWLGFSGYGRFGLSQPGACAA